MVRLKSIFLAITLAAAALCSCDKVHEFPEKGREIDPTDISAEVEVTCQIQLEVEKIVTKSDTPSTRPDEDLSKYARRYTVNIYEDGKEGLTTVFSDIFFQNIEETSPLRFNAKLHTKKYKILVWMDYVLKGSGNDLYYITSAGLNSIHVPDAGAYSVNSDLKDAQTILYSVDLSTSTEWFQHIVIDVPLQRPVAKLTFEATDFEEFAKKIGYDGPLEQLIGNYTAKVTYNGYLATGFNAVTQKLNDASVGYGFSSVPWFPEVKALPRLGFDYVFVNGESSSMTVSVTILDKDGKVVNSVEGITVPTYRGKETIVRMKFFTREYSPGIGIDPGFDGEFNVYV